MKKTFLALLALLFLLPVLSLSEGLSGLTSTTSGAETEGFYLSVKRNDRPIRVTFDPDDPSCEETKRISDNVYSFTIDAFPSRAQITHLSLSFPNYAIAGDVFTVNRDSLLEGLVFYTAEETHLVYHDDDHSHRLEGKKDFFTVKIARAEETDDGYVLEGTFEGSFDRGDIVYSDGEFRVWCD